MSRTTLLLFTYAFPYGNTEAFLETEIHYLNKKFDRIFIIPALNAPKKRDIPQSVMVIDELAVNSDKSVLIKLLQGLANSIIDSNFWAELVKNPGLITNKYSFYRLINMQGGKRRVINVTKKIIREHDIIPSETVAYSYWLDFFSMGFTRSEFRDKGLGCVSRGHRYDIYDYLYDPPHVPYIDSNLKSLDLMVFISEDGLNHVSEKNPTVKDKSIISRLGVHDPGFRNQGSEKGHLCLVSCSGIVPVKRLDLLVDGLATLKIKHPNLTIQWTHIGDGPLKEKIMQKCDGALAGSVDFHFTGQMKNPDVISYYKSNPVDVLVNVSHSEGIPVTMMEAQGCGIPVCGTSVGGVTEIVNEENGYLLPSDPTPENIADALFLFSDPVFREKKAVKSRVNWENKFNAEKNYSEFAGTLASL